MLSCTVGEFIRLVIKTAPLIRLSKGLGHGLHDLGIVIRILRR